MLQIIVEHTKSAAHAKKGKFHCVHAPPPSFWPKSSLMPLFQQALQLYVTA